MNNSLLAGALMLVCHLSHGQDTCLVMVEELAKVYSGGCENGFAEGQGEATGSTDHRYKGGWVHGFPQGVGEYTWPNGDRYQGEWLHGRREGEGTMFFADGTERAGAWKNDEYIGAYTQAVHVINSPAGVDYAISQQGLSRNKLSIQFYFQNQPFYPVDLELTSNTGIRFEGPNITGWDNVDFPVEFNVHYTQPSRGNSPGIPVSFKARIEKPGDWWLILGRK